MFDVPGVADLVAAQAGDNSISLKRKYAANLSDFDKSNEGKEQLREHLKAVIKAAMENKLDFSISIKCN